MENVAWYDLSGDAKKLLVRQDDDLLLDGAKFVGILIEGETVRDRSVAVAGIGVNYQQNGRVILAPMRTGVGVRAEAPGGGAGRAGAIPGVRRAGPARGVGDERGAV